LFPAVAKAVTSMPKTVSFAGTFRPGPKVGFPVRSGCPAILAAAFLLCIAIAASPAAAVFGDGKDHDAPPVLREIVIEGNTQTDSELILREIGVGIGEHLDEDQVDRIWDHLEDLGFFAFVDVDYDDSDPEGVVLTIVVEEDRTTRVSPYLKYDRRHKYLIGGWLEDNNLRGKGEALRITAALYRIGRVAIDWRHPWLFGQRGLSLVCRVSGEGGPHVYRPTHYRQWLAGMTVHWEFREPFFAAGSLGSGWFDQRHDFTWSQPRRGALSPPGDATYPAQQRQAWRVTGTVGVDTRDNPYFPNRGTFDWLRVRRRVSDDFASFTEIAGELRVFLPTPWDHVVALRAWGRRVDGPTPLEHWLYFGGPETVRGQKWASREGEAAYVLSVEYRAPLFLMPISPHGELLGVGLHLFADAGDAWFDGAEPTRAMQSYGAGIHLNLATNQFRFEAARTREGEMSFEFFDVFNF